MFSFDVRQLQQADWLAPGEAAAMIELPPSRSDPVREIPDIAEVSNALGMEVAERGRLELTLERSKR